MDDILLMKFGSFDYMNSLLEEGIVYCNTLDYYTKEDVKINKQLADKDETCYQMNFFKAGELKLTNKNRESIVLNVTNAHIKQFENAPLYNVYCLFSLKIPQSLNKESVMYHPDLTEFGTHFILIQNIPEFFKRLDNELLKSNYKYNREFIKYKDFSKHTGIKTPFQKDNFFKLQNEYRILIETHLSKEFIIRLGNIKDIASLHEAKKEALFTPYRLQ